MTSTLAVVIAALVSIESGGNPRAIGDNGRAVGILQMWPVAVQEANRLAGRSKWTNKDRLSPARSKEMASTILSWHYAKGIRDPVELGCRWRNPDGRAPDWYRRKLKSALTRHTQKPRL